VAKIERFEDIEAWKKARHITNRIYTVSSKGDFARDFGLRDQLRRSAVSIMSNIAEGFERDGNKEFANFLGIAKGSCGEARAQLYVALDQGYVTQADFQEIYDTLTETSRILSGLINYLRQTELKGRKFN
jgi:four helix bundle protein